jgi:hypothetical protein
MLIRKHVLYLYYISFHDVTLSEGHYKIHTTLVQLRSRVCTNDTKTELLQNLLK